MAKFRKKPVIVEAEQYKGVHEPKPRGVFLTEFNVPYVVTIHQQRVFIEPGDWILPEPDGIHYYPVKPDIFAATYEPLE